MRSPSGDHRGRAAGTSPRVIWIGLSSLLFPIPLTHTSATPLAAFTYAMRWPSGEKLGDHEGPWSDWMSRGAEATGPVGVPPGRHQTPMARAVTSAAATSAFALYRHARRASLTTVDRA